MNDHIRSVVYGFIKIGILKSLIQYQGLSLRDIKTRLSESYGDDIGNAVLDLKATIISPYRDAKVVVYTEKLYRINPKVNLQHVHDHIEDLILGFQQEMTQLIELAMSILNGQQIPAIRTVILPNARVRPSLNIEELAEGRAVVLPNLPARQPLSIVELPQAGAVTIPNLPAGQPLNMEEMPEARAVMLPNARVRPSLNIEELPESGAVVLPNLLARQPVYREALPDVEDIIYGSMGGRENNGEPDMYRAGGVLEDNMLNEVHQEYELRTIQYFHNDQTSVIISEYEAEELERNMQMSIENEMIANTRNHTFAVLVLQKIIPFFRAILEHLKIFFKIS